MEKRMKLTPEEQEIIQGMRHEKGIWNAALSAAMLEVLNNCNDRSVADQIEAALIRMRK